MAQRRTYRRLVRTDRLRAFQVIVKETDLLIHARRDLQRTAREIVLEQRRYLEAFIVRYPEFAATLKPWRQQVWMPPIVADMVDGAGPCRVGPMASVAGAMAQRVGSALLGHTDEVIVENGGDTFIQTKQAVSVGIFAGKSPLSLRIGLNIPAVDQPLAVCTSSGTVGHSLSMGCADAVSVVSRSAALADAAATAIGNRVRSPRDIDAAIDSGKMIPGVDGLIVIVGERMGFWGSLQLVRL